MGGAHNNLNFFITPHYCASVREGQAGNGDGGPEEKPFYPNVEGPWKCSGGTDHTNSKNHSTLSVQEGKIRVAVWLSK